MRGTFIVFGKLLGLLVLYWSFLTLIQLGAAIWLGGGLWWLLSCLASAMLSLTLAFFLIFETDRVAGWVGLKQDVEPGRTPSVHAILLTGSALIGVYVVVSTIPSLVGTLLHVRGYPDGWDSRWFVRELVRGALTLVLGLILMLRAELVARLVESRTRFAGRRLPPTRRAPHPLNSDANNPFG